MTCREKFFAIASELIDIAKEHGFLLSLYGSLLLKEDGSDVDLILCPWRPDFDSYSFIKTVCAKWNGVTLDHNAQSLMGAECHLIGLAMWGLVLDIQVRPTKIVSRWDHINV